MTSNVKMRDGYTPKLLRIRSAWHAAERLRSPTVCPLCRYIAFFYMTPLNLW